MNREDDDISFDFWKTTHSGHLEKSLRFEESPIRQDLFHLIHQPEDEIHKNEGFDKASNRRLQNKMNARRAREKRKNQYEDLRNRIQNLEIQNRNLKNSKVCRWCRRSLDHFPSHSISVQEPARMGSKDNLTEKEFSFEEIKPIRQRREWRGKIWIAIGILMMVIGIQLHGFTGSDEKSIRISEREANQWADQFQRTQESQFKIRMKTKGSTVGGEKEQYNIKQEWGGTKGNRKSNWLDGISFESEQTFSINSQDEELTELNIDKDLLFSIQAEFDDIGRYI